MTKRTILAVTLILAASAAEAAPTQFGALPICQTLSRLPVGARIIEGCGGTDRLSACRFTLARDRPKTEYQVENGIVVVKSVRAALSTPLPYGLRVTDPPSRAAAKLRRAFGVLTDDPPAYVQSKPLKCGRKTFRAFALYRDGRLDEVSLSMVPAA